MFFHNFKYTLKILFKNRSMIFWTFAFPIILGTLFYFAFSNIESSEKLVITDIAIVENEEFQKDKIIKEAFSKLGDNENKDQLFHITYTTKEYAKQLLEEDKIEGYLHIQEEQPKVIIKQNGMNATILQYAIEEIMQTKQVVENIATKQITEEMQKGNITVDVAKIYQKVIDQVSTQEVKLENTSNQNLSYMTIEYYTLIAMACLYGAMLGMYAINKSLANMSTTGMRVAVSPIKKRWLLISSAVASYVTQMIGIGLLFLYTIFVLNVNYGDNIGFMILLGFVGSLAGLCLGIMVGSVVKSNENTKTGIIISITMLGCFLSGMMGVTMKYIVDKNAPWINLINPANMITDGLYSLYYYQGLERFWFNINSLLIFALLMIMISIFVLRRQKYDSI